MNHLHKPMTLVIPFVLACQLPGAASQSVATPTAPPQLTEFPEANALRVQADALVTTDPTRAEELYLDARRALFSKWGALIKPHGDPHALLQSAASHTDGRALSAEAESILWRTFVGRAAALKALGRKREMLGDRPLWPTRGDDCPEDIRDKCVAFLADLTALAPRAIKVSNWADEHYPGSHVMSSVRGSRELHTDLELRGGAGSTMDADLQHLPELLDELRPTGLFVIAVYPETNNITSRGSVVTVRFFGNNFNTDVVEYSGRKVLDPYSGQIVDEKRTLGRKVYRGHGISFPLKLPPGLSLQGPDDFITVILDAKTARWSDRTATLGPATLLTIYHLGRVRWLYGVDVEKAMGGPSAAEGR